jgi:hypothetical protein
MISKSNIKIKEDIKNSTIRVLTEKLSDKIQKEIDNRLPPLMHMRKS